MNIQMKPVAYAYNVRKEPLDDQWANVISEIKLVETIPEESFMGIDHFSHLEIIFHFHLANKEKPISFNRHPRGNTSWPMVGTFAQRNKHRMNWIGSTIVQLISQKKNTLLVRNFDGIDGTPILDIKPVMVAFMPSEKIEQPVWATELMKNYW